MSHWSKVESDVIDLEILRSACEELGFTCEMDSVAKGYYATQLMKADMVIRKEGMPYDIAVNKVKGGEHYELTSDWFGGHVEKHTSKGGHKVGKLLEGYLVHKAEAVCRKARKPWKRVVHDTHTDVVVLIEA